MYWKGGLSSKLTLVSAPSGFGRTTILSEWAEKKESNRRYADHISLKLQAVDCYLAPLQDWDALEFQFTTLEVETLAEMEHERWVQERRHES
jgi:hypothetical protein